MLKQTALLVVVAALPLSSVMAAETSTFVYDELGRLVSSSNAGGPRTGKAAVSSYDDAGNRASHAVGLPLPPTTNAAIFSISSPTGPVVEGTTARLIVSKSGPSSSTMTVNYSVIDGSASSPSDFAATSGALTFRSWETIRYIDVPVIVDTVAEGVEIFSVGLSGLGGGSSIGVQSVNINIAASIGTGPSGGNNIVPVANPDSVTVGVCLTTTRNVTDNDTDADSDILTVSTAGTSSLADIHIASASALGISAYGAPGTQTITYTISDGRGGSAQSTLTVTVVNGNGCE